MNSKLSTPEWIIWVIVGIFFDIPQVILVLFGVGLAVNTALSAVFFFLFTIYLIFRGYPLFGTRQMITMASSFVVELLPAINSLPMCTIVVFALMLSEKAQKIIAEKYPEVGAVISTVSKIRKLKGPQYVGGRGSPRPPSGDIDMPEMPQNA